MSKNATNDIAADKAAVQKEIAELQEKQAAALAKLRAKQEKIAAREAAEQERKNQELAETIDGLPEMLGVSDLDSVIKVIRQRQRGTLGKLVKVETVGRTYTKVTPEVREQIVARLKVGGSGNQLSELASEFGVSTGTIFNIKKDAGLVAKRGASEAPAAETPAEAPATEAAPVEAAAS